jgi:thiol-disulfide isomerase/thioredoxin
MRAWGFALAALLLTACGGGDGGDTSDVAGDTDPGNGSLVGQTLPSLTFKDPATGQDVTTASFAGSATVKALLLNASAGWCAVCKQEAPELVDWHEQYGAAGLTILYTVFEDAEGGTPTDAFVQGWCGSLDLPFACLQDPAFAAGGGLSPYFDHGSAPLNLLVRTSDLTVVYAATGFDVDSAATLRSKIEHLVGL